MTDRFDVLLIREAMRRKMPIICICRGVQITNVIYGGTIYQDLKTEKDGVYIKHHAPQQGNMFVHKLQFVEDDSLFSKVTGIEDEFYVNSIHHQGLKDIAPIFKVVAKSADDVIEIIELKDPVDHFFLGMQFHPEILVNHGVISMLGIFKSLVNASMLYRDKHK